MINFTKDNKNSDEYIIYSIYFYVKITPTKKQALKTPINILTELANTQEGTDKLIQIKAIETLLSMIENSNTSLKSKKSVLWILGKISNKNFIK